jgi:hypothetical protein
MKYTFFLFLTFILSCSTASKKDNNDKTESKAIAQEVIEPSTTVSKSNVIQVLNARKILVRSNTVEENNIILFDIENSRLENYNVLSRQYVDKVNYTLGSLDVLEVLKDDNRLLITVGNDSYVTYIYDRHEPKDTLNGKLVHDYFSNMVLCSEMEFLEASAQLYLINIENGEEIKLTIRGNSGLFISEHELLIGSTNDEGGSILSKYDINTNKKEEVTKFQQNLECIAYDKEGVRIYLKEDGGSKLFNYNLTDKELVEIYSGGILSVVVKPRDKNIYAITYENELIQIK